jgi:hypothetical protein
MTVHVREIYPGKWYLRIAYQNIRKTKACGSKESALRLKKKLDTALELYGLDAMRVIEEAKEREQTVRRSEPVPIPTIGEYQKKWQGEL